MSWLIKSSIDGVIQYFRPILILFLLFHMSMNVVLIFSHGRRLPGQQILGANWWAIVGTLIIGLRLGTHHLRYHPDAAKLEARAETGTHQSKRR